MWFNYFLPPEKIKVNERDRETRVKWARENMNRDWNRIMFHDEVATSTMESRRKLWRKRGSKKVVVKKRYTHRINMWGCFSQAGFVELYLYDNLMNGGHYSNVIKEYVSKSIRKFNIV